MKITRQTFALATAAAVVALGAFTALPASARPLIIHTPTIQAHHKKMMRHHMMMHRHHMMMHHRMMHHKMMHKM